MAVCAGDGIERWDVIDALASLAAKSMVGAGTLGGHRPATSCWKPCAISPGTGPAPPGTSTGCAAATPPFYAGFAERAGAGVMSDQELAWRPRLAVEMDNLRAATGWALDAADVDDVALGVAILAGLAGEAIYRPGSGILAWATAGVGRADELDAAHRPVLLGLAAYDAFYLGQYRAGRDPRRPGHRRIRHLHPGAVRRARRGQFVGLGRRGPGRGDGRPGRRPRPPRRQPGPTTGPPCSCPGSRAGSPGLSGDDDTARAEAERSLAGARRIGAPTLLAGALYLHAFAVCDDHPDEALAAAEESVRLTEAGAGDTGYSPALSLGATLRAAAGDHAGAARALRTAIVHEAGTGNRNNMANAVNCTALVLAGLPDTFEAAATLAGAVAGPVLGVFPAWLTPATAGPLPTTPRPGGRHPRRRPLRRRPTAGGGDDLRPDHRLHPRPTRPPRRHLTTARRQTPDRRPAITADPARHMGHSAPCGKCPWSMPGSAASTMP